ncbi:MAG TPA: dihydrofolate reductase, partial [Nitrospirota bacterium]
RKTFESIGRPLSFRTNIILTCNRSYRAEGIVIVHDLRAAFAVCEDADEVFVCGGEEVFREAMLVADRIYLTIIHANVDGDAFFPDIPASFREIERREVADVMPYSLVRYERTGEKAG